MTLLAIESGAASRMVAQPEKRPDFSEKQLKWLRRWNPGFRRSEWDARRAAKHTAQVRKQMEAGNANA